MPLLFLAFPSAFVLSGNGMGKSDHFLKILHVHLKKVLWHKTIVIHSFS